MIITNFVLKVAVLLRGKKRKGFAPNGLSPEEWETATSTATIWRNTEIVLYICSVYGNSTPDIEWVVGPSLGETADKIFMHWCWRNVTPYNGFLLTTITRRSAFHNNIPICPASPVFKADMANVYNNQNPIWPLSPVFWVDMINVYNSLMHQAEMRERSE